MDFDQLLGELLVLAFFLGLYLLYQWFQLKKEAKAQDILNERIAPIILGLYQELEKCHEQNTKNELKQFIAYFDKESPLHEVFVYQLDLDDLASLAEKVPSILPKELKDMILDFLEELGK